MSAEAATHEPHSDHGHDHGGHDGHGGEGHAHSTLRGYLIGFGLSVVLTAIPFILVMTGVITDKSVTAFIVLGLAMVQIVVHMIYFLHMNSRSEEGWTLMALIFTVILVGIAISGSIWVMYHLTGNMTPSLQDMKNMP